MKRQVVSTLVMMSSMMGLAACGGGGSGNQFISAPSQGTPGGGGGTGGSISNTGIYIAVSKVTQDVVTSLHQFGNADSKCTIASGSANQDINCMLNIRELDLYQQGLKLEVNVPGNTCEYVADTPYWFYNREPGYGPTRIDLTINDATPASNACTYYTNDGVGHAGFISGHSCYFGTSIVASSGSASVEGAVACKYDYSASGAPNCCEGSYDFTTSYTPTTGPAVNNSLFNKTWGGSVGKCAAGPWMDSGSGWTFDSVGGYPYTQIHDGLAGFNQYYNIKAPIKLQTSRQNIYAANFYGWANYIAGTFSAATLPMPMSYNVDRNGNSLVTPNPKYDFYCLDAAYEVKHHIALYINEWDSSSQFLAYLDPGTRSGATPIAPTGSTCGPMNDNCDDVKGWQWYLSNAPALFPAIKF